MFDFASHEVSSNVINPGLYNVHIERAEWKDAKSGDAQYLNVMYKLDDNGRTFFTIYNLENKNEQAKQIAFDEVKMLLEAAKVPKEKQQVKSKGALVDLLLGLRLKVQLGKKEDSYGEKNFVQKYIPLKSDTQSNDIPF